MSIGRHETAIAFLTELEEKLDVAQVQLEIFHTLFQLSISPNYDPGKKAKIALLGGRLYTMSEVRESSMPARLESECVGKALSRLCGAIRSADRKTFDPARLGTQR
jgi:hypothetical protein